MPTPNKDNVVRMMQEFSNALSDRDKEFLVSMAQTGSPTDEDDEEIEAATKEHNEAVNERKNEGPEWSLG